MIARLRAGAPDAVMPAAQNASTASGSASLAQRPAEILTTSGVNAT